MPWQALTGAWLEFLHETADWQVEVSGFLILLLAVALSMDAFAVASAAGCALRQPQLKHYLRLACSFGFFQFAMPIAGWLAGDSVRLYVGSYDRWIAGGLLALTGGCMLMSALRRPSDPGGGTEELTDPTRAGSLMLLSVATSTDAFGAGASLGLMSAGIWLPSIVIGIVCAFITALGLYLGKLLANLICLKSVNSAFAGAALIIIALFMMFAPDVDV